jgi:hypothetical protein
MQVKPRGKAVKGQRRLAVAKAGRTKIAIYGIVTVATRPETFILQEVPGGLFTVYREEIRLSVSKVGTEVKANFEYMISKEYVGGALNTALLENGIANSFGNFLKNLKEIAELKPLSADGLESRQPGPSRGL